MPKALIEPLRAFLAVFKAPATQTICRAAYRGEDYEALAYALNERCAPPLALSEVAGIVRSVEKFMREKHTPKTGVQGRDPMPEQLREFMAEIGRKGGSRKTEAQRAASAKGSRAGNAVKSAQAVVRRAQIQALKEAGYKQREVAEKMGVSLRTVKGYWR